LAEIGNLKFEIADLKSADGEPLAVSRRFGQKPKAESGKPKNE